MKREAFVVGSDGPASLGRLARLTYAHSDAEKMARVLGADNVGFDVVRPGGTSGAQIMEDFERLASSSDPGDVLLFYFSGHGLVKRGHDGGFRQRFDFDGAVTGVCVLVLQKCYIK